MASMLMANRKARPDVGKGLQRLFVPYHLMPGIFFPIEAVQGDQPTMRTQEKLVRRAEESGFAGLCFRDVPLGDPDLGNIGQVHDPRVYPGWIAAQTQSIALATGSLILPLRHPLHAAKAVASAAHDRADRIILNFKYGARDATEALDEIGEKILPLLETGSQNATP